MVNHERWNSDNKSIEISTLDNILIEDCLGMKNYPVIETVQDLVSIAELLRDYAVELQRTEGPKDPR